MCVLKTPAKYFFCLRLPICRGGTKKEESALGRVYPPPPQPFSSYDLGYSWFELRSSLFDENVFFLPDNCDQLQYFSTSTILLKNKEV
jgi:hypothetical protein